MERTLCAVSVALMLSLSACGSEPLTPVPGGGATSSAVGPSGIELPKGPLSGKGEHSMSVVATGTDSKFKGRVQCTVQSGMLSLTLDNEPDFVFTFLQGQSTGTLDLVDDSMSVGSGSTTEVTVGPTDTGITFELRATLSLLPNAFGHIAVALENTFDAYSAADLAAGKKGTMKASGSCDWT